MQRGVPLDRRILGRKQNQRVAATCAANVIRAAGEVLHPRIDSAVATMVHFISTPRKTRTNRLFFHFQREKKSTPGPKKYANETQSGCEAASKAFRIPHTGVSPRRRPLAPSGGDSCAVSMHRLSPSPRLFASFIADGSHQQTQPHPAILTPPLTRPGFTASPLDAM